MSTEQKITSFRKDPKQFEEFLNKYLPTELKRGVQLITEGFLIEALDAFDNILVTINKAPSPELKKKFFADYAKLIAVEIVKKYPRLEYLSAQIVRVINDSAISGKKIDYKNLSTIMVSLNSYNNLSVPMADALNLKLFALSLMPSASFYAGTVEEDKKLTSQDHKVLAKVYQVGVTTIADALDEVVKCEQKEIVNNTQKLLDAFATIYDIFKQKTELSLSDSAKNILQGTMKKLQENYQALKGIVENYPQIFKVDHEFAAQGKEAEKKEPAHKLKQ